MALRSRVDKAPTRGEAPRRRLVALRKVLGVSQRQFAVLVGSSQTQVARLENEDFIPSLALATEIERVSREAEVAILARDWVAKKNG